MIAPSDVEWSAEEGRDGWKVRVTCLVQGKLWDSYWVVERRDVMASTLPPDEELAERLAFLAGEFDRHMERRP